MKIHSLFSLPMLRSAFVGAVAALSITAMPLQAAAIIDDNHHVVWSYQNNPGTGGDVLLASYTESGASFTVSSSKALSTYLATETSSMLDLTKNSPIQLSVDGISFSGGLSGYNEQLIFAFTTAPSGDLYSTSKNSIALYIDGGSSIRLGFKRDGDASNWPWAGNVLIPITTVSGKVTGFSLTLSATAYELTVRTDSVTKPVTTFTGNLALGNGWESMALLAQYRKGSTTAGTGGATIENIELQVIPEPSVAAISGVGMLVGLFCWGARHRLSCLQSL